MLPPTLTPLFTIALPPTLAWLAYHYWPRFRAARLAWLVILAWLMGLAPACGLVAEVMVLAALEQSMAVSLPYTPDATYHQSQGWHGTDNWAGRDYSAGCGQPLVAPMTGVVTAVGFDGFTGPHGSNNSYMTIADGRGREVLLLHGAYEVKAGTAVYGGLTPIGREASIGNSSGCHTHFVLRINGTAVDPVDYLKE